MKREYNVLNIESTGPEDLFSRAILEGYSRGLFSDYWIVVRHSQEVVYGLCLQLSRQMSSTFSVSWIFI